MYIFVYLMFAVAVAVVARLRHRSFWKFLLLSVAVTPLIGLTILLIAGRDEQRTRKALLVSGELRKCERCDTLARWNAADCASCGTPLQPMIPPAKR